jgi:hypothetical protein
MVTKQMFSLRSTGLSIIPHSVMFDESVDCIIVPLIAKFCRQNVLLSSNDNNVVLTFRIPLQPLNRLGSI